MRVALKMTRLNNSEWLSRIGVSIEGVPPEKLSVTDMNWCVHSGVPLEELKVADTSWRVH